MSSTQSQYGQETPADRGEGSPDYARSPSSSSGLFVKQEDEEEGGFQYQEYGDEGGFQYLEEGESSSDDAGTDWTLLARNAELTDTLATEREVHGDMIDSLRETVNILTNERNDLSDTCERLETELGDLLTSRTQQDRNRRDAETQTVEEQAPAPPAQPTTADVGTQVDAEPAPPPAAAPAAPAAPPPAPPAPPADPTLLYCSTCLRSIDKLPDSTKAKHLRDCGITADNCVALTVEQVKAQRKARRARKAASAGKKRQLGEGPVSGRLRKRARKA